MKLELIDYSELSPGIRDLVKELREVHHMGTSDSGDGTNFANGMEHALEERHVFIVCEVDNMVAKTKYLSEQYPDAWIELSWSPGQSPIIMVLPDGLVVPSGVSEVKP